MGTKTANFVASVARGRGSLRGIINRLGLSRSEAEEMRGLGALDHRSPAQEAWWRSDEDHPAQVEDRYEWQGQGELFHSVGRTRSSFTGQPQPVSRSLSTTRVSVDRRDGEAPVRATSKPEVAVQQRRHITAPVRERPAVSASIRHGSDTSQTARFLNASGVVDGLFVERFRFALMGKSMGERLRLWGGASHSTDF